MPTKISSKLQGINKINLKKREKKNISFTITTRQMALIINEGKYVLEPGEFMVSVGGCEKDYKIWFIQIIYRKLSKLMKNEKNCN